MKASYAIDFCRLAAITAWLHGEVEERVVLSDEIMGCFRDLGL